MQTAAAAAIAASTTVPPARSISTPAAAAAGCSLATAPARRAAAALADLVRNDTRVLLCWSDLTPAAQRRLRAALGGVKGLGRRRAPVVCVDGTGLPPPDTEALRAELWGILRRERLCALAVRGG